MAIYKLVSDKLLNCLKDIVGAIQCSLSKPNGIATLDSTGNVPLSQLGHAGGGGAVSSVFTRTGAVVASNNDYTFAQIGSTPTTLAGYGIIDAVSLTGTQTLTNKTLTSPLISSIINTGTLTLPTSTDTLIGRATTDTLTNKGISGSTNTFSNIPESAVTNLTSDLSGKQATVTLTTTGTSGAATFNSTTGALNVPNYATGGGTPGGTSGQMQFNNAGAFGGTSGATATATVVTLVAPVLGTPASGTLTNCTALPVSTGISGLATGIATFLATPSSANLATAITDETGTGVLVFATSPTVTTGLTLVSNAIATTPSNTKGLYLQNTTVAATGAQQESPSVVFEGQGWKTTATAASQAVALRENVLPVQGAANPTFQFRWDGSVNASAYTNLMILDSTGNLSTTGSFVSGTSIQSSTTVVAGSAIAAGAASFYSWGAGTTQPNLFSDSNFNMTLRNGVNAQELWVDNTFTSATNFEAGVFGFIQNSNILSIGTKVGTSGTLRNVQFIGGTIGMGVAPSASAELSLKAGTTTVAPMIITGGTNLTTPVNGAIENDSTHLYYTSGGTRFQLDQQVGALIKYQHTIFTPTTGQTITLINGQYNIVNPAGTIAALTINLPSSPANNDTVYIKFTKIVSAVTYASGTVVDGIASPVAGSLVVLVFDSGTSSWY